MKISRSRRGSFSRATARIILAFYNFVRTADDIADHPSLAGARSSSCSIGSKTASSAKASASAEAVRLRQALAERGLPPRHAQDLLTAFRMDVTKLRYRDWDDLIDYCTLFGHAGRAFRARCAWREPGRPGRHPMRLCAALQIINHLQDCGAGL